MTLRPKFLWLGFAVAFLSTAVISQPTNLNTIGTFEGSMPSFWNVGNAGGAKLTWATDQHRSGLRSLKIEKTTTGDSASFVSDNMADIWAPFHNKNVDIFLGAWVRTQGVNTAPANDDARWFIIHEFYDTLGVKIGTFKLPVPQTSASTGGWVADTSAPGDVILPKDSYRTIVKLVAGKNATGTVWFDDIMFYGRSAWAGQNWGTNLEFPSGYYYWLPPVGGNDGVLDSGFENSVLTTEAAHSGLTSLKFVLPFNRVAHDGFIGAKRLLFNSFGTGIKPGDRVRLSVWLKASDLVPDSAALYPGTWSVGFTPLWFAKVGNNDGYDVLSSNDFTWQFPAVTAFDWKQYTLDVEVPANAKGLEVRMHIYARFTGTIYWDDLTVEKLDVPTITEVGGFEGTMPAFWNTGNVGGAKLSWATDQHRSGLRSLKIEKTTTGDSASFVSDNMADIWAPIHNKNVDIFLGAWVRTEGVNTAPANDDARWFIIHEFYDTLGVKIGTFKLPVPQTSASTGGWVADTSAPGDVILPKDSYRTIVKLVAGKNATGTVWFDDVMFYGRGAWAGQNWGTNLEFPTGWYYWLPPVGGNDGVLDSGFENTVVSTEQAHTGMKSVKFDLPFTRASHDGFIGAKRVMFASTPTSLSSMAPGAPRDIAQISGVNPGDRLRLSVWLKASNLVPDSAALYPGTWSVGFTPLWFAKAGNNDGYDVLSSADYTWQFPAVTSFGWSQYTLDVEVPANAKALEVRLHVYARFTGTIYWDDLTVEKLDIPALAEPGTFEGTMPAFWNVGNAGGATLSWATDQHRSGLRSLKIAKTTTGDSSSFVSDNMADIWAPIHNKNVDIFLGAWVRTEGVNTAPANDDARWFIIHEFYDTLGVKIGTFKLPVPQTSASTGGWVADTSAPGDVILPKDSYRTIVKLVAGKNATGTVWFDDIMFYGRAAWAGQNWGTNLEFPTGWYYWLPPVGGNDGVLADGFENTVVSTEAAHTGMKSLKFDLPFTRASHDGFVGLKRVALGTNVKSGDVIRITAWLKASNLVPDSAALYPGTWSVGLTPLWFAKGGNNDGYDVMQSSDYTWQFPAVTSFDWTPYTLDLVVPENAKVLEVRTHIYARFTGTIYWDDITVQVIGALTGVAGAKDQMPKTYELGENYPNPFNPSTTLQFGLPTDGQASIAIFNTLGQEIRRLADGFYAAGRYEVVWDGRDNSGRTVGTGVYLYRLVAGQTAVVKKMLLVK
ncbi:MAG: T9SS type A sorting domain-containing protein [Ignavibacteriae bacterium]|nr:T9SS type A sorting domain-containing protein [Ignavibacteriota bacterium]